MDLMMAARFWFFVSAAIQMDCLARRERRFFLGCDMESKATITDFGWVENENTPLCAFPMPKNKLGIELYA
jgi:hypothetical protein